ncbi:hypothetical protein [Lysobacter sp. CA199]|uniref:hypothetical protein n=1 Tax=Lysobacter sp. CA199 TaxID=3455608 RepID=UPI003F8D83E2
MRRISSSISHHFKRTLPVLTVGAFSAGLVAMLSQRPIPVEAAVVFAIALVASASYYCWFMRGVLDEVFDDGDRLLVRNRGVEDTVLLRDVVGVKAQRIRTLVRLTLALAVPGKFGDKIVFLVRDTFLDVLPYGPPPLIKDLENRIAAHKQNSTRDP